VADVCKTVGEGRRDPRNVGWSFLKLNSMLCSAFVYNLSLNDDDDDDDYMILTGESG